MAMPLYEDTEKFSFTLPNFANMSFSFPFYLRFHIALLALGRYLLFSTRHLCFFFVSSFASQAKIDSGRIEMQLHSVAGCFIQGRQLAQALFAHVT